MMAFIWVRYELRYGIGAVIAIFHTVLVVLGLYALLDFEFNLTTVAAFLTLVGYQVNDSVVVFDRIRETLHRTRRHGSFEQLVNEAVNQTLSRTLLTGGTVLAVLAAMLVLGGEVLRGFSFVMFVGILVGTYSSIWVAASFSLLWEDMLQRRRERRGPARRAPPRARRATPGLARTRRPANARPLPPVAAVDGRAIDLRVGSYRVRGPARRRRPPKTSFRHRSRLMQRIAATTLLLFVTLAVGGCDKFKAREHFHRANNYYKEESYESALHDYKRGLEEDPTATQVWRSVGFSRARPLPSRGRVAGQQGVRRGRHRRLPQVSFRLSRGSKGPGVPGEHAHGLRAAGRGDHDAPGGRRQASRDLKYQSSVIAAMAEAGMLERALQQADKVGAVQDAQIFHTIGVTAWSKSYRNPPADVEQAPRDHRPRHQGAREDARAAGQQAVDGDALSYINLLWREKVKVEIDPFKQQDYIKIADGVPQRADRAAAAARAAVGGGRPRTPAAGAARGLSGDPQE